ncbi:MAG: linear amide C-N hydrolase [Ferruginibacter sp.]
MKKFISFFLVCFFGKTMLACTTFCINKDGHIVFGRNYDWVSGAGIVNTNLRGLFKTSMNTGNGGTASWVSKYGSISFNQYGKEFPTGGMNEKGLIVELMWLDGTRYPSGDARPAVGVLQWIQYQLDNSATTAEVINSDSQIRISEKATPLHYLIADATGNVASIEFLNGKMIVHKDETLPFPVLTNNTYASSVQVAKPILGKQQEISLNDNSLERFVKACSMVKKFRESNIAMPITDYAFSILDKVSQGDFTKWSIVYDISNKTIHFKTEANPGIKTIRFSAFDLACSQPAKMFNMNQDGKGDISKQFILPDKKLKQQIMDEVIAESSSRVNITKKEEDELLHFEEGIKCNN